MTSASRPIAMHRRLVLRRALLLGVLAGAHPCPAAAQRPAPPPMTRDSVLLDSLLRAHRHPIAMRDGALSGAGAQMLAAEASRAQFMVIGEFHNGADIPRFSSALFRSLRSDHGFGYFAVENDPEIMEMISDAAARGRDSVFALARRYPHGLQFRNRQELEMHLDAEAPPRAARSRLWGLDQAWGALHLLDRLAPLARTDRARAAVAAVRADAAMLETTRPTAPGAELARFISRADSSQFLALRDAFGANPGARAERALEALRFSNRVYLHSGGVRAGMPLSHLANDMREQEMKRQFMFRYRAAQASGDSVPRVLARFGHVHAGRGTNGLGVQTLGNFLSEFARANRLDTFHLTVYQVNEPGTYWTLADFPDYLPLANVGSTREWFLVDLRPLRPFAAGGRLRTLSRELREVIFSFDAALLIGGGRRGSFEGLP